MIAKNHDTQNNKIANEGASLRFAERLNYKWHSFCIRRTSLWHGIQHFGNWIEHDAAKIADELNQTAIQIKLSPTGNVEEIRLGVKKQPNSLEPYRNVWKFLSSLDIHELKLDVRLERNQIEDIFILLYAYREKLPQRNKGIKMPNVIKHLVHGKGIHIACTDTSLQNSVLKVDYSYCTLRFSRGVRWFEEANRNFQDHRALFHAAPRYAILIGFVVTGPIIFYAIFYRNWTVLILSVISAFILLGLAYLFFMIVGSVEYDNEEKAYNLRNAYGRLKVFTNRIQSDVRRARIIQEKFLPDMSQMPLADQIAWGSSFLPAEEIGGDYFDVSDLDDQRIAILFSDVSGHGMAAAFITAILKTTFQAWIDTQGSLTNLIHQLNTVLCRLTPVDSFATVFAAVYDVARGELSYASGGHQPEPWLIPADKQEHISFLNQARNLILGVEENLDIKTARHALRPGDVILFASDGIVENRNLDGDLYGTSVFTEFLHQHRTEPIAQLIKLIEKEMESYSRDAEQSDDRTILAFSVKDIPS